MARQTNAKKHIHKYYRAEDGLWYCALPNCTHFMPLNVAHQIEGRSSKCWECEKPISMTPAIMDIDKPKCIECRLGVDEDALDDFLTKKGL